MSQIVPAILTKTKSEFAEQAAKIMKLPMLERIQVDFSDGIFDPNTLLPISEIDSLSPGFHWEADLMISEPQDFLDYNISGFKTLILHYEAFANKENLKKAITSIKSLGLEPALSIGTETPIEVLLEFKDQIKHFQLMSIKRIGFQGEPFAEEELARVRELRKLLPGSVIAIDGGVRQENIKSIAQAGADLICIGSALSKAADIIVAYENLQAAIVSH